MALEKYRFNGEQDEDTPMILDMDPKLRKRLKLAASKDGVTVNEYLIRILQQTIPDDVDSKKQERKHLTPEKLARVVQLHKELVELTGGKVFEDSVGIIHTIIK